MWALTGGKTLFKVWKDSQAFDLKPGIDCPEVLIHYNIKLRYDYKYYISVLYNIIYNHEHVVIYELPNRFHWNLN